MTSKRNLLQDHFERLKEIIPEVYQQDLNKEEASDGRLFEILKRSLRIIEAVYIQEPEMFHAVRVEEYGHIINDLKKLGYNYMGNSEILEKATNQLIMSAKKPMKKAKGGTSQDNEDRKAI